MYSENQAAFEAPASKAGQSAEMPSHFAGFCKCRLRRCFFSKLQTSLASTVSSTRWAGGSRQRILSLRSWQEGFEPNEMNVHKSWTDVDWLLWPRTASKVQATTQIDSSTCALDVPGCVGLRRDVGSGASGKQNQLLKTFWGWVCRI